MKKKNYIILKNVSCDRNEINIFSNISFIVNEGSFIIIKGGNGSGKTSLLLGLAVSLSLKGDIIWNKRVNSVGYVGHKNALKDNEKVIDYINFWRKFYCSPLKKKDLIIKHSLKKILDYPTHLLSYGQKKLLSFIRLKMSNSSVWLLDEPLSGLDNRNKQLVLDNIEEHNENRGATIMTTHDEYYLKSKSNFEEINID